MSENQKCPNLIRGGGGATNFKKCLKLKNVPIWQRGGQHFSKMSQIQKCPKGREVGGVNPNWDIVPNFLDFLF